MKTTNTLKKQKKSAEMRKENVEAHLNHNLFFKKFICDRLDVFSNSIGTIKISLKISKTQS